MLWHYCRSYASRVRRDGLQSWFEQNATMTWQKISSASQMRPVLFVEHKSVPFSHHQFGDIVIGSWSANSINTDPLQTVFMALILKCFSACVTFLHSLQQLAFYNAHKTISAISNQIKKKYLWNMHLVINIHLKLSNLVNSFFSQQQST